MKRLVIWIIVASVGVLACDRRDRFAEPDTPVVKSPPAVQERSAYLSVSDLSPVPRAEVIVAATVTVDEALSVGSYRVRLAYDSSMLTFLEEITEPGMMRVINPQPGEVIVAGASSTSSTDGRLFTLRFRVHNPAGLNTLMLAIDELNDAAFIDQRQSVTLASRLVRDSTLVRWKVPPR